MSDAKPTCWAISDGAAGNERQATALAEALGFATRIVRIHLRQPWDALAPRLTIGASYAVREADGRELAPPWPDIAIGCGRRAALVTRALRKWSRGATFTVQILDPRIDTRAFDVVIAPRHDHVKGDNVIQSIGALNPVSPSWLADARARFARFAALPEPRTAVLIGATNSAQRLDDSYFDALFVRLAALESSEGGSFLVSISRRTPEVLVRKLRRAFATLPGTFFGGANRDGENPYAGFLAWADRIVVTPDSVNMLSEASATGKPVYTFAPRAISGKLARFHEELRANRHLLSLEAAPEQRQCQPLAETHAIAELVRKRYLERRGAAGGSRRTE